MKNLVYTELTTQITFEMMEDKLVMIIWDNASFMFTTEEHSSNYKEEFYPVNAEIVNEYDIEYRGSRLYSEVN